MEYRAKANIYKLSEVVYDSKDKITNELKENTEANGYEVKEGQLAAWDACLEFLTYQYGKLINIKNDDIVCIFEYFLPLEGGRRPDVIMLFEEKAIILEFKNKDKYTEDDISQTIGYKEDLSNYHKYIRDNNLEVESYLVLTKGNLSENKNDIDILNKFNFVEKIDFNNLTNVSIDKAEDFINSDYEPLPDILSATYDLFKNGKLPYIQSILDSDIEKAYNKLKQIVFHNMNTNKGKNIVFISGVPGAGKTLVALKFLYNYNAYIKRLNTNEQGAIYLSGNGPLINVLQGQIDNAMDKTNVGKAYIRGAKAFKDEFMKNDKVPNYNVLLFDEAQRAWDEKKMGDGKVSEPDALLNICDKIYKSKNNVTLVCFVGEGQSIHEGEEKGIKLWQDALRKRGDYNIYLPSKFYDEFKNFKSMMVVDNLHLDVSIRNNFIDISKFVEALIGCNKEKAKEELELIKSKGFVIKVSREFDKCREYVSNLENKDLKYGMLISSKANEYNMRRVLGDNSFTSYIDARHASKWFLEDCEKLKIAASEFACQGLEIDFPIVVFGGEYYINDSKFVFDYEKLEKKLSKYDDPKVIMENIYRVLLSRSRKGMFIFIPRDGILDDTYNFLIDVGVESLG